MSDFVHESALTHLSAAEARLGAVLGRPRRMAVACVIALTALGWLALGLMAGSDTWASLCRPGAQGSFGAFAVALPMWVAMTLAMMLPTAGPMILTYAEIADTAARQREPVVSPLVIAAGYLAVWLGFALVASVLQAALAATSLVDNGRVATWVAGTIFVGTGLYQFSALKRACLTLCQRPFPFFFSNWTTEPREVFRLGLRQGLHCLGCCWAMMLLMFAVGTMNIVWMAALGVIMTIEKMSTTLRVTQALGAGFIAIGFGFMFAGLF